MSLLSTRRPIIVVDLGYQGLQAFISGADVFLPIRGDMGSDPEGNGLSQADRDYNAEISSIRIIIERVIGEMKRYGILTSQFGGTPDQMNDEINIISGLVNLKRHWPRIAAKEAGRIAQAAAWRRGT